MHFRYMTYDHAPAPGVMKLTILVDPSLIINTIYILFLILFLIYAWE